eukprot:GHRQ01040061.1.p1 GENE.GHRQ01040061.1~~GHRQ01040061.1.p1  ORF type:complete len:160 (-),score=43.71 GHRQ01040061.1:49-528(-)
MRRCLCQPLLRPRCCIAPLFIACPSPPLFTTAQVNKAFEKYEKQLKAAKSSGKNTKATQDKILATAQRQAKKRGGKAGEPIDDAGSSASNAPQKWSDYSVAFHFPEPTELPPPLMQLIDVDFKYPGEGERARCWPQLLTAAAAGLRLSARVQLVQCLQW